MTLKSYDFKIIAPASSATAEDPQVVATRKANAKEEKAQSALLAAMSLLKASGAKQSASDEDSFSKRAEHMC